LQYDSQRRKTRFEEPFPECGAFYGVIDATPAFLLGVSQPISDGIYRTDLEFGSGPEQHRLIILSLRAAELIQAESFSKCHLRPVSG